MQKPIKLKITIPSGEYPLVEYGRHFDVQGVIEHTGPLPADGMFSVRLLDAAGHTLRHAVQTEKDCRRLYLNHPDLTSYPEETDPGKEGLLHFGFPELLVRNADRPMDSLRDATLKCWYSDDSFKALIVSGTGVAEGQVFDDGVGFLDERGMPYPMLERGNYTIEAELNNPDGTCLAKTSKAIQIGSLTTQTIVRFNPREHRLRMTEWCRDMGFGINNDTMPGYLEPYTGTWLYHMGLLPLYRACDIAMYRGNVHVHMFVYLVDPTSTSYETELAYLQTLRVLEDPKRFTAYHYDIGEAMVGRGRRYARPGQIVVFPDKHFLALCRVDIVNGKAKENYFDLNEEAVEDMVTDLRQVTVQAGSTIAIAGVVRPWQLDPLDFRLRRDNTYEILNSVRSIRYEIDDGETVRCETRSLLMERFSGHSIGTSVYEFYNLFLMDPIWKGRQLVIRVCACDNSGEKTEASETLTVHVV